MSRIQLNFSANPATTPRVASTIQKAGLAFQTVKKPVAGIFLVELIGSRFDLETYINNYCQGDYQFSDFLHGLIQD